jgi:hypothetical protein
MRSLLDQTGWEYNGDCGFFAPDFMMNRQFRVTVNNIVHTINVNVNFAESDVGAFHGSFYLVRNGSVSIVLYLRWGGSPSQEVLDFLTLHYGEPRYMGSYGCAKCDDDLYGGWHCDSCVSGYTH